MQIKESSCSVYIEEIVGDYQGFFYDLRKQTESQGVYFTGLPIVQLLYRTETLVEYTSLRDRLKPFCKEFVETLFNDRAVSILILKEPLLLEEEFAVSVIELPAPRPAHMYPSGLESVGVLIGNMIAEFKNKYKKQLHGVKEHGKNCQPAFITFENNKTIKFYSHTLEEIVYLQGWRFENLLLPQESFLNKIAELVNAWQWYFHSGANWQELIKEKTARTTECGLVYELSNPIDRPNESFAVVDLRKTCEATLPHYHHIETEVYFILEGSGYVVVNGKEEFVQKEATIVIPPETIHFIIPQDNLVLAAVNTPPFKKENYVSLGN